MHILVTDVLACPRCGPDFGLIVLADSLIERRVIEGSLGCANCRDSYPISGGVVDLRTTREAAASTADVKELLAGGDEESALRFAALLGVADASGVVLVHGATPALVAGIAQLLPNATVVGASREFPPGPVPHEIDWLLFDGILPFHSQSLRGLALVSSEASESAPDDVIDMVTGALASGARIVADRSPAGLGDAVTSRGLELLLEQDDVMVASNTRAR